MNNFLIYKNLREYVASFDVNIKTILAHHEKMCGEFIPHVFACDMVRDIDSLYMKNHEILNSFVSLVGTLCNSKDTMIIDLLYASLFPTLDEYSNLKATFLRLASPSVVSCYLHWQSL